MMKLQSTVTKEKDDYYGKKAIHFNDIRWGWTFR